VRKRRHIRYASDRNTVRFTNPEGHLPTPIAAHAVHVEEVPQLASGQGGANPSQAVLHNTISLFNGIVLLADVFIRWLSRKKPVPTTIVTDLSQEQQVLSDALRTSNDFEEFMAAFNEKSNIDNTPDYVAQPQENLYLGSTETPKSCVEDASICGPTKSRGL